MRNSAPSTIRGVLERWAQHSHPQFSGRHRRRPDRESRREVPRRRLVRQTVDGLGARKLIIGVDRLDYSKGIPQRMEAYESFLPDNSDHRGRVTYLQIAPTSRIEVPEYTAVSRSVNEALVE